MQDEDNILEEDAIQADEGLQTDLEPEALAELSGEEPEEKKPEEEEEYGKRVKKRLDKMTFSMREAERERDAERAQREALEAELGEYRKQSQDSLTEREKSLKEQMAEAAEDADMATYHRLNEERLEVIRQQAVPQRQPRQQETPQQQATQRPNYAQAAQDWIDNNDWFSEDSVEYDERKAARARRLADSLQKEYGYDNNDPELYEEIDKRLNGGQERRRQGFQGDASVSGAGSRVTQPRNQANRLTKQDLGVMKQFGLNPNDPEQRKAFLAERYRK